MSVRLEHWLVPAAEHARFRPTEDQLRAIVAVLERDEWLGPGWKDRSLELTALIQAGAGSVADLPGGAMSYEVTLHLYEEPRTVPKDCYDECRDFTVACPSCEWECLEPIPWLPGQAVEFEAARSYALPVTCRKCGAQLPVSDLSDLALYSFGIQVSLASDSEYAKSGDPSLLQDLHHAIGVPFEVVAIEF
jgi:hypothetical protein